MTDLTNPHYDLLGGETGVRCLVDRFYDLMDTQVETWELRKLHPENLQSSRDKLFMFLSGWLGGPPLYENAYGHPRLRARHLPFAINSQMRDQWLLCMNQAIDEQITDLPLNRALKMAFARIADHMRNQVDQ